MFKFALGQRVNVVLAGQSGTTAIVAAQTAYLNGSIQYGIEYINTEGVVGYTAVREQHLAPTEGGFQGAPCDFKFELGSQVQITTLDKPGKVTGAHRVHGGQTQYVIAYDGGGTYCEAWIEESLLA